MFTEIICIFAHDINSKIMKKTRKSTPLEETLYIMSSPETITDIRNTELYIQAGKKVTERENVLDTLAFTLNLIYLKDHSVKWYLEYKRKNQ